MQDFDLIDSIIAGNQKDFERLITKYQPNVFRVSIGLLHNKEDAEEVTQDVFLKLYYSLRGFNKRSSFSTWLYRLTVNTTLNFLRRKKRRRSWTRLSGIFQLSTTDSSPESRMVTHSDSELIRLAIDSLPEKQRLAFVLTKYEELSQKEVAPIMNISEGAVEQLVLRAKNNLRKKLARAIGLSSVPVSKGRITSA
jgi:RNA polymerase sigma-70 factor (ECF subfamily)